MTRLLIIAATVHLAFAMAPATAQDGPALSDVSYWQTAAGWWEGENTYFDSAMDYTIRDYASLVHVEIDGTSYRETEHRFYPEGIGTQRYANGLAGPDEGVELIQVYTGTLIDAEGTVLLPPASSRASANGGGAVYSVLSDNDAVRQRVDTDTGAEAYRYYVNLVGTDRRYKSNFGLVSEGENTGGLRAFILYREHRIDGATFAERRAALREEYNVTVLNAPDPGSRDGVKVTRLDR